MGRSLAEFVCTDLVTIEEDASIATLETRLDRPVDYGVPVVGRQGRLCGVVAPIDLLRLGMQVGSEAQEWQVNSVCRRNCRQVSEQVNLRRVRRLMLTRDLDSLLVTDSSRRLVGIVFRADLERCGLLPRRVANWRRPLSPPRSTAAKPERRLFAEPRG